MKIKPAVYIQPIVSCSNVKEYFNCKEFHAKIARLQRGKDFLANLAPLRALREILR